MIEAVRQIAIKVGSLSAGRQFYGGILGLRESFTAPNVAAYDLGSVRWLLIEHAGFAAAEASGTTAYLLTDRIEEAHAGFLRKGAADGGAPHCIANLDEIDVWVGFVIDPFNNLIGLMEEKSHG
jgi:catechol 2,3-dioxygenase-like lactoylglutathione lyase family enzyme